MADVTVVVRRLGLGQQSAQVAAKAGEFVRLATARLGSGGLGQFELCKGAACVELACMSLGVAVDASLVARHSGVGEKVYRNAKVAFQKVLGVTSKASARDLCVQFGCARHDQSVRAALAAYKERFVKSLPAAQQARVDFGRPVFLAAAFHLVAKKHKVAVDRAKLLGPLGVAATEFAQVCASMGDLCSDLVGDGNGRKRKAEEVGQERRALIDRTGGADSGDQASDSEEEVVEEGQVGHRINPKKQRQREYDEWKAKMTAKPSAGSSGSKEAAAAGSSGGGDKGQQQLTEKKLRQATLSFGPAAASSAQPAGEAGQSAAEAEAGDSGAGKVAGQEAAGATKAAGKGKGKAAAGKAGGKAGGKEQKEALQSRNQG